MKLLETIAPPDAVIEQTARKHWNDLAKPLGSLGVLEDTICRIAALTGSTEVCLDRRVALVFCADNGVVAEGVTQTGADVTATVAQNIVAGRSSINHMAAVARCDVIPIDMGMLTPVSGTRDLRIAPGTQNLAHGPAMTRAQATAAIEAGIALVRECRDAGYQILATGEMGIGNTTTASALAAVLLGLSPASVTGRGAGLSDAGLMRKIAAIEHGIAVNAPDPNDALGVLAALGGFDIAGMAGAFLGGAIYRIPVLIDGFISTIAALVAARLAPNAIGAMFASHISAEPATRLTLDALGVSPLLCAELRLGEGTGAVAALPLLDMALSVYHGLPTFEALSIEAYQPC